MESVSLVSPALTGRFFTTLPPGKPHWDTAWVKWMPKTLHQLLGAHSTGGQRQFSGNFEQTMLGHQRRETSLSLREGILQTVILELILTKFLIWKVFVFPKTNNCLYIFQKMACCYSPIKENNNNQDISRHGPGLLSASSAHPPVGPQSQKCQGFYIALLSCRNPQGLDLLEFFRIDRGSPTLRPSHKLSSQDRGPHPRVLPGPHALLVRPWSTWGQPLPNHLPGSQRHSGTVCWERTGWLDCINDG